MTASIKHFIYLIAATLSVAMLLRLAKDAGASSNFSIYIFLLCDTIFELLSRDKND